MDARPELSVGMLGRRGQRAAFGPTSLVLVAIISMLATLGLQHIFQQKTNPKTGEALSASDPTSHARGSDIDVRDRPGVKQLTVILTADPGDLVGQSEAKIIENALGDTARPETRQMYCTSVIHGSLFGQRVLLVITGIGPNRAAICVSDLFEVFNDPAAGVHRNTYIKEVFFLGTAGFSARRGGLLDPALCDGAASGGPIGGGPSDAGLVTLGDVCISPRSTSFDCQHCEWQVPKDLTQSTICRDPYCTGHRNEELFGQCNVFTPSTDLADEVVLAARRGRSSWPQVPDRLRERMRKYWDLNANATGRDYPQALRSNNIAYDYGTCAECTSNRFWAGAPYDNLARKYVAELITVAESYHDHGHIANTRNVTAYDTLAVSAMEGMGWMSYLAIREDYRHFHRPIPFVNLRGAADYTMPPIKRWLLGWDHDWDWLNDIEKAEFVHDGYLHAINTLSTLMLDVLRFRNNATTAPVQ